MANTKRSPREVLDDHLAKARSGNSAGVEDDLARNYSPDLVTLTGDGVYRGYDGMRQLARRLMQELPQARFQYRTLLVEGEIGFLEWSAESPAATVEDGADSYLIRDGRIVAQTIHYTVRPRG